MKPEVPPDLPALPYSELDFRFCPCQMASMKTLLLMLSVLPGFLAEAKPATPFYIFFDDGCEHPATACQGKTKLPAKLKKNSELSRDAAYLGSVQTEFASKNEAGIDAFEHYFSDRPACQRALKKMDCGSGGGD